MLRNLLFSLLGCVSLVCGVTVAQPEKVSVRSWVIQVGHTGGLQQAVFSGDGRLLLTNRRSSSNTIDQLGEAILWDAATGEKLRRFPHRYHKSPRQNPVVLFCRNDTAVVVDGGVFELDSGERIIDSVVNHPGSSIYAQKANAADTQVAFAIGTHVAVFDLDNRQLVYSLNRREVGEPQGKFIDVSFDPAGDPLALLFKNDGAEVWNLAKRRSTATLDIGSNEDVRFSPDARWVYTSDWPDTGDSAIDISIYDAAKGTLRQSFVAGNRLDGAGPLFLPDGESCIVGIGKTELTEWNLRTKTDTRKFNGHAKRIVEAVLLSDGKTLETRSLDRACRWDLSTGDQLHTFECPIDIAKADYDMQRRLNADGRLPVLPCPTGASFFLGGVLFETTSLQPLGRIHPADRPRATPFPIPNANSANSYAGVFDRQFSPDGKRMVIRFSAPYRDGGIAVQLRDAKTGEYLQTLAERAIKPSDLIWSPDGRRVIFTGPAVRLLWDVETGTLLRTIEAYTHIPGRFEVAFSTNAKFVYSYRTETQCRLWKSENGDPWQHDAVATSRNAGGFDNASAAPRGQTVVSPNGYFAASIFNSTDGRVWRLWDLKSGDHFSDLALTIGTPGKPFFSSDSRWLAVPIIAAGREPGGLFVDLIDLQTRKRTTGIRVPGTEGAGRGAGMFLPDNKRFVVHAHERSLYLFNLETGQLEQTMTDTHPGNPNVDRYHRIKKLREEFVISPNMRYLVAQYGTEYTIIWDLRSGEQLRFIEVDNGSISARDRYRFSEDSRRLLCAYIRPARILKMLSWEEEEIEDRQLRELRGFIAAPASPYQERQLEPVHQTLANRFAPPLAVEKNRYEITDDNRRLIRYNCDASVSHFDMETTDEIATCYFVDGGRSLVVQKADAPSSAIRPSSVNVGRESLLQGRA